MLQGLQEKINNIDNIRPFGLIHSILGSLIYVTEIDKIVSINSLCTIKSRDNNYIAAEVVGFKDSHTLLMPYGRLDNIGPGCQVFCGANNNVIYPDNSWLGRVIDGFASPVDKLPLLTNGSTAYPINASPIPACERRIVASKLDLGIKVLNTFTTCCIGQRMGIFSGSGVGKSILLAMLAKFAQADVIVIGLIGERGREVREFLHKYLGQDGLAKSVVVVATSDEPALMRRRACYTAMAIAEYFRDQNKEVLCLIDSITRFAMAIREVGLAVGEMPTSKGYTSSVFVELPLLLERAGPGKECLQEKQSNITGLFTILVEGDDHNEPISDSVRGILDGHIVLDRKIAERNRFPAVNVLRSISRTMPDCNSDAESKLINKAKKYLATYNDMEELIRLGAYSKGTDQEVDESIKYFAALEEFIAQSHTQQISLEQGFQQLESIMDDE